MNLIALPAAKIHGDIICPPDKSITQRALLLGALQNKDLKIINPLLGADPISTANALKALGANIDISNEIVFSENNKGISSPAHPLDLGNSGTGLRLLMGMVAGLGLDAIFTGDASLSSRPMKRIIDPLSDFGAVFQHDGFILPIKTIASSLNSSFSYSMPIASAQVKSSILLAALAAGSEVTIMNLSRAGTIPRLCSKTLELILKFIPHQKVMKFFFLAINSFKKLSTM